MAYAGPTNYTCIPANPLVTPIHLCSLFHTRLTFRNGLYHRSLLLKLDTQPRSHLVVEDCIQQGICTAPTPSRHYVLLAARIGRQMVPLIGLLVLTVEVYGCTYQQLRQANISSVQFTVFSLHQALHYFNTVNLLGDILCRFRSGK